MKLRMLAMLDQVLVPVGAADAPSGKGYLQCYLFYIVDEIPGTADVLREVFEDPSIVKVMHDCRQDVAALSAQTGISVNNIFDTQARHLLTCPGSNVYLPACHCCN